MSRELGLFNSIWSAPPYPELTLILILLMWMGRLEIIPVLLLLSWPLGQLGKTLGRLGRQTSS